MNKWFYFKSWRLLSAGGFVLVLVISLIASLFQPDKISPVVQKSEKQENSLREQEVVFHLPDRSLHFELDTNTQIFYEQQSGRLAWHPAQTDSLLAALTFAHREGLDSNFYNLSELREIRNHVFRDTLQKPDNQELVRLDILLTDTYLRFARDLYAGRINPAAIDTSWRPRLRTLNWTEHLHKALLHNQIQASLLNLVPHQQAYAQLKKELAFYQNIAKKGNWDTVAVKKAVDELSRGKEDAMVLTLKKHLALLNEIAPQEVNAVFDEKMAKALRRYQAKNGITPSGKLDYPTVTRLNVPLAALIRQLCINMERFKWMPENLGRKYVVVNIPSFELIAYEDGGCKAMDMRVIVGRDSTPTPIFSDTMEHLIFSPEWSVPLSIARKEMLPIFKNDPNRVTSQGIHVYKDWSMKAKLIDPTAVKWEKVKAADFNYKLVAMSGSRNPLGYVMFQFPNPMYIYLHDTPYDNFFQWERRDISHGCIRIQYPAHLATFVLSADTNWTRNRILEYMFKYYPVKVNIPGKEKIMVHLLYQTAWVDEKDRLHFALDIYRHDEHQWAAIQNRKRNMRAVVVAKVKI
jgi:L,D-transpeptidase YcbB